MVETRADKKSKQFVSTLGSQVHRKSATGLPILKGKFKLNSTNELNMGNQWQGIPQSPL